MLDGYIDDLLRKWAEVREAGQTLPAEELTDDPVRAAQLQVKINALLRVDGLMQAPSSVLVQCDEPSLENVETSHRYEIRSLIAETAMSSVYCAFDERLRRQVALKVSRASSKRAERFRHEASVTGQLDHPGVAAIYSSGSTHDGLPFHCMRLIPGDHLGDVGRDFHRNGPTVEALRELLRHVISACRTVGYAHSRNIVHNDLKPANIVIGDFGDTVVLDWGEACKISVDGSITVGQLNNTPPGATRFYAAPERYSDGSVATIASDVYSLGATLYYVLCGSPPVTAPSTEAVVDTKLATQLKPPRLRALEAVCDKALEYQPAERYESLAELADDLQRWLDDKPCLAYPETQIERGIRFLRSHALGMTATGLAALLFVGLSAVFFLVQYRHEADIHQISAERHESALRLLTHVAAAQCNRAAERRLDQLKGAAADSQLRSLLERAMATKQGFQNLSDWLTERGDATSDSYLFRDPQNRRLGALSSLFVLDRDGNQLGRYPSTTKLSFGTKRPLGHKSYFHGYPEQRKVGTASEPISRGWVSSAFESGSDVCRKVAFSVPIKDGDNVLGVLVMTVEMKDLLRPMEGFLDAKDFSAMIVDPRPDWRGRSMTVLRHSSLVEEEVVDLVMTDLESELATNQKNLDPWLSELADPRSGDEVAVAIQQLSVGWLVLVLQDSTTRQPE